MSKPNSFNINSMFGFFKKPTKFNNLQEFLTKQDLWNEYNSTVVYVCKLEKNKGKEKENDVGTLRHHLFVGEGFKFADMNSCLEQFKKLSDEFLDAHCRDTTVV
mgnify:CR=1 FL=1